MFLLLGLALIGLGLASTASAAMPVGKDGKIHACYRAKGKNKGAMRIAARCKKGEKKVAWNAVGPAGVPGVNGQPGATGASGAQGEPGKDGDTATTKALETQIAGLKVEVSTLKDVLNGVAPGDLTGVLAKLQGISGLQLTEAVDNVPVVDSLCTEVESLPGGINALRTGVAGLSILGLAGLSLDTSSLPVNLSAFTCPS